MHCFFFEGCLVSEICPQKANSEKLRMFFSRCRSNFWFKWITWSLPVAQLLFPSSIFSSVFIPCGTGYPHEIRRHLGLGAPLRLRPKLSGWDLCLQSLQVRCRSKQNVSKMAKSFFQFGPLGSVDEANLFLHRLDLICFFSIMYDIFRFFFHMNRAKRTKLHQI